MFLQELRFYVENSFRSIGNEHSAEHPIIGLSRLNTSYEPKLFFNASAGTDLGDLLPYYRFNYGVVIAAIEIFNWLVTDESFCPWFEMQGEEVIDNTGGMPLWHSLHYKYRGPDPQCHFFMPIKYLTWGVTNTKRTRFVMMLTRSLVQFVSYHEQAHYHLGHCYFVARALGAAYPEVGNERSEISNDPAAIQQLNFFMEHQADSFAFQWMGSDLVAMTRAGYSDPLFTVEDYMISHCVAAQVFCCICELYQGRLGDLYSFARRSILTHPTAASRMMHLYRLFLDFSVAHLPADYARAAKNTFLVNEGIVAKQMDVAPMSIEMVHDVINDSMLGPYHTIEGQELAGYRHGGLLRMFEFDELRKEFEAKRKVIHGW